MSQPLKVSSMRVSNERLGAIYKYWSEVVAENGDDLWSDTMEALHELLWRRADEEIKLKESRRDRH